MNKDDSNIIKLCYPAVASLNELKKKSVYSIYLPDFKKTFGLPNVIKNEAIKSAIRDLDQHFYLLSYVKKTAPVPSKSLNIEFKIAPTVIAATCYFINYLFEHKTPDFSYIEDGDDYTKRNQWDNLNMAISSGHPIIKISDLAFISKIYNTQLDLTTLSL
jgi:hypothetical protein